MLYNKVITILRSFYYYLIEEGYFVHKNPFNRIKCRPVRPTVETIINKEYEDLLAPEKMSNGETLKNQMSKGFSHYYYQLSTGRKLTFKCLCKTYITQLVLSLGLNARVITRHSGEDVIIKHYLDQKVISKVAEDFEVFQ